jgi:hypothetical protein
MTQGFSGVGLVNIHTRTGTGGKGIGRFIGNCPKLSIKFNPKTVERQESMTSSRAPLRRMTQATSASIELVTDEFNKKNFALAVRGRIDEVAADAATTLNTVFPAGTLVGDVLSLGKYNVNTVAVTDSTGAPKTLTLNTNYSLDPFSGDIVLLDLTVGGPFVLPLKASFKQGAVSVLSGLAVADTELWLSMNGVNADTGQKGVLDCYRVRLDPTQAIDFINNDYQDFAINGTILIDSTKLATAIGGQNFAFAVPSTIE